MRYMKPWPLFKELKRITICNTDEQKLLGLDVGEKFVGLSISDHTATIASPLRVLVRKKSNRDSMIGVLQNLVSEYSIQGFIFGSPWAAKRHNRIDAYRVKAFVEDLGETGHFKDLRFTYWDEGYTSKNVEMMLKPLDLNNFHSKQIVDKFAAVGILQAYLDFVNKMLKRQTDLN